MANINVPAEGWDQLDAPHQDKIRDILRSNNLLNEGDDITSDNTLKMAPGAPVAQAVQGADDNSTCTTACNVAQQAAQAGCSVLPWPASMVCNYAAEKAGDACRSLC